MVTAIIVGAGHRAVGYANYALDFPEKLKIVGVADPSPERRAMTAKKFGLAPEQCYSSAEELAASAEAGLFCGVFPAFSDAKKAGRASSRLGNSALMRRRRFSGS